MSKRLRRGGIGEDDGSADGLQGDEFGAGGKRSSEEALGESVGGDDKGPQDKIQKTGSEGMASGPPAPDSAVLQDGLDAGHLSVASEGGASGSGLHVPSTAASVLAQATYAASLALVMGGQPSSPNSRNGGAGKLMVQRQNPWTAEEDDLLRKLVLEDGDGERANWNLIAKHFPLRTGIHCRERYLLKFDPALMVPWTMDEDRKIVAAQAKLGNRFSDIAKQLPGRSDVAISEHWVNVLQPKADQVIKEMTAHEFTSLQAMFEVPELATPTTGERRLWTPDEDEMLAQLVEQYGQANWTNVAKQLKGRQPKQCRQRYFNKVDPSLSTKPWTEDEDKKIVAAQHRVGNRFAEIAKFLHGRSESLVSHRWHFALARRAHDILESLQQDDFAFLGDLREVPQKERRHRAAWTDEEDDMLVKLVNEMGQGNWPMIAHHMNGRLPKQCRDRFVNKLNPELKNGSWTEEEDRKIVAAQSKLGNRWHEMAKCIYGRSELAIKDRWYAAVQPRAQHILATLQDQDFHFLEATQPPYRWRKPQADEHSAIQHALPMQVDEGSDEYINQTVEVLLDSVCRAVEYAIESRPERLPWTPEEDALLGKLVEEHGQGNWTLVAKQLQGRLPKQCRQRYLNKVDPTLRKGSWTLAEDKKIVAAHSRIGGRFAEIAKFLDGRSETLVNHRWHKVLRSRSEEMMAQLTPADFAFLDNTVGPDGIGLKLGPQKDGPRLKPWTEEEDAKLLKYVYEFGQSNWQKVASMLTGRLAKQCRDRYVNKVDPTLKKGGWTEEEDLLIVAAHSRLGERWAAIGKFLDGRSESSIKTRWYSSLKPRSEGILKGLGPEDFKFLQQAPPSQRWKKDTRPYKGAKTPAASPSSAAANAGGSAAGGAAATLVTKVQIVAMPAGSMVPADATTVSASLVPPAQGGIQ